MGIQKSIGARCDITRQKDRTSCSIILYTYYVQCGHTLNRAGESYLKYFVTILCALVFAAFLNLKETPVMDNRGTPSVLTNAVHHPLETQAQAFEQRFSNQIEQWLTMLAEEVPFTAWQQAKWEKYPLGPGTHGWIVMITSALSDRELGYMVVSATTEGDFALVEYGIGPYPLFSTSTLQSAIAYHGLEQDHMTTIDRYYYHPLQAIWHWQGNDMIALLNGIDGEAYYIDQHIVAQETYVTHAAIADLALISSSSQLIDRHRLPIFDPYDNMQWLIEPPLNIATFADLSSLLEQSNRIIHSAHLFGNSIRLQVAIIGYHLWDNAEPYIMIDQQSTRYIPFSLLLQHGQFFEG